MPEEKTLSYEKHFISDCKLPEKGQTTFLTDKKVDAELYAILMQYSIGLKADQSETGRAETVVYKDALPCVKDLCATLGKSRNTYKAHLKYLIDQGYVVEHPAYYLIDTRKENIYLSINTNTIKFLNDTVKEPVWKVYLYLGQRWKWKQQNYVFTVEEICEHIGRKANGHSEAYAYVNNILTALVNNGLIEIAKFYDGKAPRYRLKNFKYHHTESV